MTPNGLLARKVTSRAQCPQRPPLARRHSRLRHLNIIHGEYVALRKSAQEELRAEGGPALHPLAAKLTSNQTQSPVSGLLADACGSEIVLSQLKSSSNVTVAMSTSSSTCESPRNTSLGTPPCQPVRYSHSNCSCARSKADARTHGPCSASLSSSHAWLYAGERAARSRSYLESSVVVSSSHSAIVPSTSSLLRLTNSGSSSCCATSRALAG